MHRSERRYGKFTRSFRLPEDADADAIRATAKDGVITIAIAKSEKATAREIEVELA
ncbi:MAG: Hsp20 family protein [Gammaproteobacteria bacterium]|nr:Hsp20 family protein [Gammaproteobacteria bacterium]